MIALRTLHWILGLPLFRQNHLVMIHDCRNDITPSVGGLTFLALFHVQEVENMA